MFYHIISRLNEYSKKIRRSKEYDGNHKCKWNPVKSILAKQNQTVRNSAYLNGCLYVERKCGKSSIARR